MDTAADKNTDQSVPDAPDKNIGTEMDTGPDEEAEEFVEVIEEDVDEKMDTSTDEKADELVEILDENSDLPKDTLNEEKTVTGPDQSDKLADGNTDPNQPNDTAAENNIPDKGHPDKCTDYNMVPDQNQPDETSTENTVPGADQPDKTTVENNVADPNQLDKTSNENTVSEPDQPVKITDENTVSGLDQPVKTTDEDTKLVKTTDEDTKPVKTTDEDTKTVKTTDEDTKPVKTTDEDTKSVKTTDENTEKMDVDEKIIKQEKVAVKRSIESDSEIKEDIAPSKKHAGITRLCFEEDYDNNEETVTMTFGEVKEFLVKKVTECINSPVNPLFALQQRAEDLKVELASKVAEYKKLCQGYQKLHENQEKFLRHAGLLPKVPTTSVSVSVDLPILPDSIPRNVSLPKVAQQSVQKNKELSITRVGNRTVSANTSPAASQSKPVTNSSAKGSDIECIDLTDDTDITPTRNVRSPNVLLTVLKHPAPLPPRPVTRSNQPFPPKPSLKISSEEKGIILQWDFPRGSRQLPAPISRFEIFGYQEVRNAPINTLLWKKIGNVDAMSLPMACTLTQFAEGSRYHFTIRAVDVKGEHSHYSEITSITYHKTPTSK